MFSETTDFFTSTVKPTVNEYIENVRDIRRARLSAIVLYHLADYLALEGYTGKDRNKMGELIKEIRKELIAKCPEFSLIRDVADATKHAKLFVAKRSERELSTSKQITGSPGIFQAPFGEGVFGEAAIVFVILDNGTQKPLEPAISAVMKMWEEKLNFKA